MYITQEADYAVRIVYCLSREKERREAKYISEKMGVTLRFSLKILRKLVASGILRSYKGQKGGYELAKPAREITLNDVITTVDGPYMLNRCLSGSHQCSLNEQQSGCCTFRRIYADISKTITDKLSAVTFESID